MRICLLSPSLLKTPPDYGGAIETFTYELGLGLAELKNEVLIITRNGADQEAKIKSNLTIHSLKIPNNKLIRGLLYNFKVIKRLVKLKNIDILHTQGTSIFPSAYITAKWRKIPIIHTEHVYHPWISTPYDTLLKEIKKPLELFLGKLTLSNANKIVVANELMKKSLQTIDPRIKPKVEIVPQGINQVIFNSTVDRTYLRKKYDITESDKLILYVGRIVPEKNIEKLVQAFSALKMGHQNIKLLLVGPKMSRFPTDKSEKASKYYQILEKWIRKNELKNSIIFTGAIPYSQIPYYYAGANLLIQPSPLETFGRAIFEGASMGIPFICRMFGKEPPKHLSKASAILLNRITVDSLHSAMRTILEDEAEFKKNAEQAASHILKHYNWIEIAKKYYNVYKKVVKN